MTVALVVGALTVAVIEPGLDVTLYTVMVEPPLFVDAVQETRACVFCATAVTLVGADGTPVVTVTELEGEDGCELPTLFVATTLNV